MPIQLAHTGRAKIILALEINRTALDKYFGAKFTLNKVSDP